MVKKVVSLLRWFGDFLKGSSAFQFTTTFCRQLKIFFLLSMFAVVAYADNLGLDKIGDYEFAVAEKRLIRFTVFDSRGEGCSSKIIKAYEKNLFGQFSEIGQMETVRMELGQYGEGFQWISFDNGNIIVQQSFGDGKYLVISKLHFKYTKRKTLKLVGYTEEHIDRFSADKDFSDIVYEIPENMFFGDIDSEFVREIRSK